MESRQQPDQMRLPLAATRYAGAASVPSLVTGDQQIDLAFRIALGDLVSSIAPFQDGLLDEAAPVLLAGLGYEAPWTRDAAINIWNGAGLLYPDVARNTLFSVVKRLPGQPDQFALAGQYDQYWDAILWAIGAWSHYLYTGDADFLAFAFGVVVHALRAYEANEFDAATGLFRGPACYGDGVAAYPDVYADGATTGSILDWRAAHPEHAAPVGYGMPMQALSTNCLYYAVYRLLPQMADTLGEPVDPAWEQKAEALRSAISAHFWDDATGRFRYLVDPFGDSDAQEGLGHSFSLLFGVATPEQAESVFRAQHLTPAGIPCLWPNFNRYASADGMRFGRHCGTVWPHIQAFWADAAARYGEDELLASELRQLATKACRDSQFAELYHPLTGEMYGGAQEMGGAVSDEWRCCPRQTWSATGYLRVILRGLLGMRFEPQGIRFQPRLLAGMGQIALRGLPYRRMLLDVVTQGQGSQVIACSINGASSAAPYLAADGEGEQAVYITLG